MQRISSVFKTTALSLLVLLQVSFYPGLAFAQSTDAPTSEQAVVDSADESPKESSVSTPEAKMDAQDTAPTLSTSTTGPTEPTGPREPTGPQTVTGPTQPNGAAATTYSQNEDGTWENDHYIWDPVTHQTRPKVPQEYSYNPTTKAWDTTEWYYSPETGRYEANTISVAQDPTDRSASGGNGNRASISNTGPSSNNTIDLGGETTGSFDLFFDVTISNRIGQMSRSGDVSIQGNTRAGNALTGDAETIANILNLLQSSWGDLGSEDIATFVANVDGDVVGDIFIDPSQIAPSTGSTDIDINVEENARINNDVDVSAQSGNTTVRDNTQAGSARSGNARAVVNLLNLINSAINANKSFLGVLNINGNLEGDILLPPGMLEAIIARTGPGSNNQISGQNDRSLNVNVDDRQRINNAITTDSASGNVNASGNTQVGNATTGRADSNITLLNLTGKRVVAKNAVLVFVNVLGKWVGLIMNAPSGTYAVAATGSQSNNTITADSDRTVDVDVTRDNEINNTVRATARSGDVEASGNTSVGDASSGDATVAVNALNMIDSNFDISDWFGVLFINVYGTWHGSFGVDTPYGNARAATGAGSGRGSEGSQGRSMTPMGTPGDVFSFIPSARPAGNAAAASTTAGGSGIAGGSGQASGSSTQTPAIPSATNTGAEIAAALADKANLWPPVIAGMGALMLLFGEQLVTAVRRIRS